MTEHLITPPHVLVEQLESAVDRHEISFSQAGTHFYTAGADQELEAVREYLCSMPGGEVMAEEIRAARRPKPPSIKQQAQRILVENGTTLDGRIELEPDDIIIIRRALEQLND